MTSEMASWMAIMIMMMIALLAFAPTHMPLAGTHQQEWSANSRNSRTPALGSDLRSDAA